MKGREREKEGEVKREREGELKRERVRESDKKKRNRVRDNINM